MPDANQKTDSGSNKTEVAGLVENSSSKQTTWTDAELETKLGPKCKEAKVAKDCSLIEELRTVPLEADVRDWRQRQEERRYTTCEIVITKTEFMNANGGWLAKLSKRNEDQDALAETIHERINSETIKLIAPETRDLLHSWYDKRNEHQGIRIAMCSEEADQVTTTARCRLPRTYSSDMAWVHVEELEDLAKTLEGTRGEEICRRQARERIVLEVYREMEDKKRALELAQLQVNQRSSEKAIKTVDTTMRTMHDVNHKLFSKQQSKITDKIQEGNITIKNLAAEVKGLKRGLEEDNNASRAAAKRVCAGDDFRKDPRWKFWDYPTKYTFKEAGSLLGTELKLLRDSQISDTTIDSVLDATRLVYRTSRLVRPKFDMPTFDIDVFSDKRAVHLVHRELPCDDTRHRHPSIRDTLRVFSAEDYDSLTTSSQKQYVYPAATMTHMCNTGLLARHFEQVVHTVGGPALCGLIKGVFFLENRMFDMGLEQRAWVLDLPKPKAA